MNYTPIPPRELPPSYVIVGERASQTGLGADLREMWGVLLAGWRTILISLGALVALALLFMLIIPATYQAYTDVLLDPRQRQVVGGEVIDPRLGVSALGADTLMLDSQVQVILSRSVLVDFIRSENLTADAELMSGTSAQFMAFTPSNGNASTVENDPVINEVITSLFEHLVVERETNTYVIRIAYKSKNPYKAAHYANRVAEIYLDQLNGANLATTQEASDALAGRLTSLRRSASQANAQVEQYRQANGLIGTQDLLLVEQDLRDLNAQLSLAKVATGDAEAQLVAIQGAVKDAGPDRLGAGSLQSGVITQLQIDMSALDVEEALLRSKYLPRHPEVARVLEQKAAVRASIQAEARRIAERAKSAVLVAKTKQQKLEIQVTELEARAAVSNTASVRLRELEREALASQAVYETFLTRSKEVLEQTELPSETARIISRATPPTEPKSPKVVLVLGGAIMTGLMLGLSIVWVRHIVRADIGVPGGHMGRPAPMPPYNPRTPPPPRPAGGPPTRGPSGTGRPPMHPGMYPQPATSARSNLPNSPLYRPRTPTGAPARARRAGTKAWQMARPPRGGTG